MLHYGKEKEVNVGHLSKSQLKEKLDNLPKSKFFKRNKNGKVGIKKANDYKHLPDAPRKMCHKQTKPLSYWLQAKLSQGSIF